MTETYDEVFRGRDDAEQRPKSAERTVARLTPAGAAGVEALGRVAFDAWERSFGMAGKGRWQYVAQAVAAAATAPLAAERDRWVRAAEYWHDADYGLLLEHDLDAYHNEQPVIEGQREPTARETELEHENNQLRAKLAALAAPNAGEVKRAE